MLQDTYTATTTRGHRIRAHVVFREMRDRRYAVCVYVNGRRDKRRADYVTLHLAEARKVAKRLIAELRAKLEARPERRRPYDRRRKASAYLIDATEPAQAGFRRVKRVWRCVICGRRDVAACDAGERCPFHDPKL